MKYIANYNYRRCLLSRFNDDDVPIKPRVNTDPPSEIFSVFDDAVTALREDAETKLAHARQLLNEAHGYMSAVKGIKRLKDIDTPVI